LKIRVGFLIKTGLNGLDNNLRQVKPFHVDIFDLHYFRVPIALLFRVKIS
jgi:hypothetical protein